MRMRILEIPAHLSPPGCARYENVEADMVAWRRVGRRCYSALFVLATGREIHLSEVTAVPEILARGEPRSVFLYV